jgi:hypothetical protein
MRGHLSARPPTGKSELLFDVAVEEGNPTPGEPEAQDALTSL